LDEGTLSSRPAADVFSQARDRRHDPTIFTAGDAIAPFRSL
jgi:hypothetical protein